MPNYTVALGVNGVANGRLANKKQLLKTGQVFANSGSSDLISADLTGLNLMTSTNENIGLNVWLQHYGK